MLQISSMSKTLEIFFDNPSSKHYLADISRNIKIAHTSVKNNLKELVKLKIILEEKEKKGTRIFPVYKANFDSNLFKNYKFVNNISSIMDSGLINHIQDKIMPKCIVLFGSYSRGEDFEGSDIDLFVESKEEKLDLKLFEKKLHRKIELHFKEDFNSYPKELKNNIINGIKLKGYLEVCK